MTIEKHRRNGFMDGYNDALNDQPRSPEPDLALSLCQDTYLFKYIGGYEDGYGKGRSDRKMLLQGRSRVLERNMDHQSGWTR